MDAETGHGTLTLPDETYPARPTRRGFAVVRILLGLVLLAAAGLKLYGLNVTALPRVGWFATPQVQLVTAEWELVLGLWLLSGAFQAGAWLAAAGTFAVFAGVSSYFGWTGVASCGCFGAIAPAPGRRSAWIWGPWPCWPWPGQNSEPSRFGQRLDWR